MGLRMQDGIQSVLFVVSYDAYADAAKQVAAALRDRVKAIRFLVMTQDGRPFFASTRLAALETLGELSYTDVDTVAEEASRIETDVLFLFFAGAVLERTIRSAHANQNSPPLCVSCFPGVVLYRQEAGFSQRLTSDIILFNSRKNVLDYEAFCTRIGATCKNALLFGFPALLDATPRTNCSTPPEKVAYIDQKAVPACRPERLKLARYLLLYAERFPQRELWVVCRDSDQNRSAHAGADPLDALLLEVAGGALPRNIRVSTAPAGEILADTDLCIGIASTILIHAISLHIPTVVLGDFGWEPYLGNLLFQGSGLECSFDSLLEDAPIALPSSAWLEANVTPVEARADLLMERLLQLSNSPARQIINDAVAQSRSKRPPPWRRRITALARALGWR